MSFSTDQQNLQFLSIQYLTLYNLGINLNALNFKDLLKNYWKFVFFITCTIYVQYGIFNFAIHNISDLEIVTRTLSIFNQACLILVKITLFLRNGDMFLKLLWDMNKLAEMATKTEYKKWLSENYRSQLIVKIYFYACWIAASVSIGGPIAYMAYTYLETNEINRKFPYGGRFPFDNGSLLVFSFNYIFSILFVYAQLNLTVSIDGLYGWYIYNVSAHFRILRCKVSKAAFKFEKNENYNDFTQDIGSIVYYHNKTLKFVQQLNDIFGGILWVEVMMSCLQMCFVIYTLNNDNDFSNLPFNFMVFVVILMQLIIYCFGGEKIKNESLLLNFDIYMQFPWHKMSPQQKKLMLLPLMRSQKLSVLRGLFFEVDRDLLVFIMKKAFSFNALLTAIKE